MALGMGAWSIEELRKKTGLSREELEELLSVKPNSAASRLYRFALSNQTEPTAAPNLISLLPDHPLNNLKTLEENLMRNLNKEANEEDAVPKKKRKKKHRTRKKKIWIEQTCQPPPTVQESPEEISESQFSQNQGKLLRDDRECAPDSETLEGGSVSSVASTSAVLDVGGTRPSLWDIKDMSVFSSKREFRCNPQKIYTVREGKILEVSEGSDEHKSNCLSCSSESDVE